MNRKLVLPALLSVSLLAVAPLAMADEAVTDGHMTNQESMDHGNMHQPGMEQSNTDQPAMNEHHGGQGGQHAYRDYDPVQRVEKHLSLLEKELKLKTDQQSAWKAYSDSIVGFAKDKSARIEELREERSELRNMDMASKLDKLAQMSRNRADRLEHLASDTRTFQQALSPQQQTTFNNFWEKQMRIGKGKHRPTS